MMDDMTIYKAYRRLSDAIIVAAIIISLLELFIPTYTRTITGIVVDSENIRMLVIK